MNEFTPLRNHDVHVHERLFDGNILVPLRNPFDKKNPFVLYELSNGVGVTFFRRIPQLRLTHIDSPYTKKVQCVLELQVNEPHRAIYTGSTIDPDSNCTMSYTLRLRTDIEPELRREGKIACGQVLVFEGRFLKDFMYCDDVAVYSPEWERSHHIE